MISYVDKHIIDFVDEWGDKILPQLDKLKYQDLTKIFSKSKKCRLILNTIKEGKKAFIIGFFGCKGMIKKWLYDERGRMLREKGRGVVSISPSVIVMSTIDIVVPFISSDEILLAKYPKDRPYNLEKEIIKEVMKKASFNPEKDIIFMFFVKPKEIRTTINRFRDELKYIITREYCRAKGILAIKDPKWIKYHAQEKVTPFTNAFFFGGIKLTYTQREAFKNKLKL